MSLPVRKMKWSFYPAGQFPQHRSNWDLLNDQHFRSPVLSSDFVEPLVQTFVTEKALLAIGVSESKVRAAGILERAAGGIWRTCQPSQAPLGLWIQDPSLPSDAVLRSLVKQLPGLPIMLGLSQLDPEHLARPTNMPRLSTLDYIDTARITIDRPFDVYWNDRGKNLKQNVRKQKGRLQKEGRVARLECITRTEDIRQAIDDYGRLEISGWKASEGTAVHSDNSQGLFYRRLLERHCQVGGGRVFRYWIDDIVAAMDLCIQYGDTLVVLKTTYNEDFKSYSPAILMRHDAFAPVFDDNKIRRIEFYGRVMEWHTRWTSEIRTLYHLNYYRWGFLQSLRRIPHALRPLRLSLLPSALRNRSAAESTGA